MKKKRILVLTSTFPRWKNDTKPPFVYELEKRLAKNFEIHVVAPHHHDAKKEEMMEGLHVHRFQYFWPSKWQKLCDDSGILPNLKENKFLYIQAISLIIFELIAAIRICRKHKFDLIHAHWIIPQGIIALLIKMLWKIDYIITSWGADMMPFKKKNKFLLWIYKLIITKAHIATSVNQVFCKEMENLSKKRIYLIPNGVDINKFKITLTIKTRNILFVGRLVEKKGLIYLIEALKQINNTLYGKLIIVGKGPLRSILEKKAMALKFSKKVTFLGGVPNNKLVKLYNECAVAVFPSITTREGDREGFPTVYLEAMACGCPVIATSIEGVESIIVNKVNGLIVDQKKPEQLAKAIYQILSDNRLRRYISHNALMSAKNKYSWSIVAKKYLQLIKRI